MPENTEYPAKDQNQVPGEGEVQGEGDHVAGRRFQDAERSFAAKGPVEEKARKAAEALEDARRETTATGSRSDAKLDKRLDDSFPASDPASASPGAD